MNASATPAAPSREDVERAGTGAAELRAWADRAHVAWRRADTAYAMQRGWPAAALLASLAVWRGVDVRAMSALALGGVPLLAAWWGRWRTPRSALAPSLEAKVPTSRNLLTTALELVDRGVAADVVVRRACTLVASIDPRTLFPVSVSRLALSGVLSVALLAAASRLAPSDRDGLASPTRAGSTDPFATNGTGSLEIASVSVEVAPPAYRDEARSTVRDPRRLDVPAGSQLTVQVQAPVADGVTLEVLESRTPLVRDNDGFRTTWSATRDAILTLVAWRGADTTRALIGVQVQPDAPPRVRIIAPGRDLVLPRADTTLQVRIEADDDHALASLRLRYTKVSGSGERYAFVEGEVPLRVQRTSRTRWTAAVAWPLAPLALEPGDVVVYRAVATDRRPSREAVESDAWLAELPAGRGDGAAGFAVDVGELRYALSQQMIVLRIERLLAARDSARRDPRRTPLDGETLVRQAANIAIEQRRVRAEFVFMMGGELAEEVSAADVMGDLDEHQHAEVDADLSAGRVRNEGRTAVFAAIRAMSRTTTALADTLLPEALRDAREAVAQLERAFSTARFLMRPLTEREAIDPTRRLTGSLLGVTGSTLPRATVPVDGQRGAWRAALQTLAADTAPWLDAAAVLARFDTPDDQALALAIADAADRRARGDARSAQGTRDSVSLALTRRLVSVAPAAPRAGRTTRAAHLEAAAVGEVPPPTPRAGRP
jgi:hypothetical protein